MTTDDGRSLRYAEVLDGVDVELVATLHGVKETLVLRSAASPRTFTYPLSLDGLTAELDGHGGVVMRDSAGASRLRVPPGWMVDSASGRVDGAYSTGVQYSLVDGGQALQVTLDNAWLDDPARVYPIRVDPTLVTTTETSADTYVDSALTGPADNTRDIVTLGKYAAGSVRRTYIHFRNLPKIDPAAVTDADFRVWNLYSASGCTAKPTRLRRVTQNWDSTTITWGSQPTFSTWSVDTNQSHGGTNTNGTACAAGYLTYTDDADATDDLEATVKDWLGASGRWGVRIGTPDETDASAYKALTSLDNAGSAERHPTVIISHEDRPPTAQQVSPAHGLRFADNPTFKSTYRDPNDQAGAVTFTLWDPYAATPTLAKDASGNTIAPKTVQATNGQTVTTQFDSPLLPNGWYEWTAEATNDTHADGSAQRSEPRLIEKSAVADNARQLGFADWYHFQEFKLSDRTTLGVNVANGNLVLRTNDLQAKGAGIDTDLTRVYNSLDTRRRELGVGWSLGPARQVGIYQAASGDGDVYFEDASGSRRWFDWTGTELKPPKGTTATLTRQASGGAITGYQLTYRDQTKYTFVGGTLDKITDRWGHIYDIGQNGVRWTGVTDTRQRAFTAQYEDADAGDSDLVTGVLDSLYENTTPPAYRRTTYTYNAADQMTSFIDLEGNLTTYAYTGGRLTEIRQCGDAGCPSSGEPVGGRTTIEYWPAGTAKAGWVKAITQNMTDPVTNSLVTRTTAFDYEPTALAGTDKIVRTTVTDARAAENDGQSHTWTYETERDRDVHPSGGNSITYDERNGRVSKWTDPKGHTRKSSYNPTTNVETYTDASDFPVTATFDGEEHLKEMSAPGESPAKLTYSETGAAKDSPSSMSSPQGTSTSFGYHSGSGAMSSLKDGTDGQWTVTYIEGLGAGHPKQGQPLKITDPRDNVTQFGYDAEGHRTLTDYPNETGGLGDVTQTWDRLSRPDTMTDGRGNKVVFDFDRMDRLVSVKYGVTTNAPDGSMAIYYDYDVNGNRSQRTDAVNGNSIVTTFSHDAWNRMRQEKRLATLGKTYTYDYDGVDNLKNIDDGNGTSNHDVAYRYDAANLLDRLAEPAPSGSGTLTTHFGYDKRDNRTCTSYPNGVEERSTYTDAGQIKVILGGKLASTTGVCNDGDAEPYQATATTSADTDIAFASPSTGIATLQTKFTYDYENPGSDDNNDGVTDTSADGGKSDRLRYGVIDVDGDNTSYSYDNRSRLTKASTSGGTDDSFYEYGYDKNSNRILERAGTTSTNAAATSFAYRASNAVCWKATGDHPAPSCAAPPSGATTYIHDGSGNMKSASDNTFAATYNDANQTTQLTAGGQTQSYSYAGPTQDERLTAGAQTYTDTLLGTAFATQGGSDEQHYTRDESKTLTTLRNSAGNFHYLHDGLGSTAAVTNSTGAVSTRYSYDPYGATTTQAGDAGVTAVDNPWRYTGQYQDPTGLYKMGARYLQPGFAQWTQVDPSEQEANAYLYVTANPINLTDPTGLYSGEEAATNCLIGAAAGVAGAGLAAFTAGASLTLSAAGSAAASSCVQGVVLSAALDGMGVSDTDANAYSAAFTFFEYATKLF